MRKKEKVTNKIFLIFIIIIEYEPKLFTGYKNRVRQFIYNIIYEPCKIADSNKKQFSFRPDNFSQSGKIKLKPFVTDYNRINNYLLSHKEEIENYSHREKNKINYNKTETLNNFDNFI